MHPSKKRKLTPKVLAYILMMLTSGCGSFVILPNHGDNDAYIQNKKYLENSKKLTFIEITAEDLLESPTSEIYLFSNWCPHCFLHLKELTAETNGNVRYVSANYDIRFMSKKYSALDTIYILSNATYGTIESKKIMAFGSELTGKVSKNSGVPQRFVWNVEKEKYEWLDN